MTMEALLKIADNFALGTLPVPEHPDDTIGQDESRIHEDANAAASSPSASSSIEQRLEDEIRLRQFTENVLDSRQQELEAQEATNRELAAKVEELKRELASTQEQLAEARGQARAKGKKLSDARDQIFRLQPTRKDVTETEAVEGFRGLCSNVQRWVENRMKPILDDLDVGKLRARAPSTAGATRLTSFMREAARRGMHIDQSDIYHVTAVVMNYLSLVFFSKSFYSPLDDYEGDATLTFLNELELSMSRLPRDAGQCREWRSETLTALTSRQSFKTRRTRYVTLVSEDLATLLAVVVPKMTAADLQSSLRRAIIEPAADLAHQLHLAPSIYSLKWPARGANSRLEVYECLNLASGGMPLDLTGTTPNSPSRQKVSYLFDVAPGLFVERLEAGKKMPIKAICRPTVLVFGGDVEVAVKPTVLGWLWEGSAQTGRETPTRPTATRTKSGSGSIGTTSGRKK